VDGDSYHPRSALGAEDAAAGSSRRRRQAEEPSDERVSHVRSIEVRLPEEAADLPGGEVPPVDAAGVRCGQQLHCPPCGSLTTFFIVLVALAALLATLIATLLWVYVRRAGASTGTLNTPTK